MNGLNDLNEMLRRANERAGREKTIEDMINRFCDPSASCTEDETEYSWNEFVNSIKKGPARKTPGHILAETLMRGELSSSMITQKIFYSEIVKLDQLVTLLESELKDQAASMEKIIADLHEKLVEIEKENALLRAESAEKSEKLQERRTEIYYLKEELASAKAGTPDPIDENNETFSNKKSIAISAIKNGDIDDPQVNREIDDGLCQTDEIIDLTDEVTISEDGISTTAANAKK